MGKGKPVDLTDKKYGWLTVLEEDLSRRASRNGRYWKCVCRCGNQRTFSVAQLYPTRISCGCLAGKRYHDQLGKPMYRKQDYTGKRINYWTIVGGTPDPATWVARCDCGVEKEVDCYTLIQGLSKGCASCLGSRLAGSGNGNWKGYGAISSYFYTQLVNAAKVRNMKVSISIQYLQKLWEESGGLCALSGI